MLVRNVDSWASIKTYWIRISQGKAQESVFLTNIILIQSNNGEAMLNMLGILQILLHLNFAKKISNFTEEKTEAQIVLINIELIFQDSSAWFQTLCPFNYVKQWVVKKKKMVLLGITALERSWVLLQPSHEERRKEISNMETAHYIGAEEGTNLVLIKEENNSWLSLSPTFIW